VSAELLSLLDPLTLSDRAISALLTDCDQHARYNKLEHYRAYPKLREFHAAGKDNPERLLMAANRVGKTFGGAHEVALHLTGRYPDWWEGREFTKGNRWWVASETTEMTVAGVQGNLLGRVEDGLGTGAIPKDAIVDYKRSAHGFPGSIQFAIIRHGGGGDVQAGQSYVGFKSYDQGREKFQADTLDGVWLDEEPDSALYFEALTRISTTQGMVFMTFTPLKGPTAVVTRFLLEKPAGTIVVNMTIDDAEHIPAEEREKIIARYPAHEREARTKGVPAMGSGRIFPVTEATISVPRFKVPDHWYRIGGLDFGWNHPSAGIELCVDRDHDRYFVTRAFRQREATPIMFAAALRSWDTFAWLPWAWPHDGLQHDKGSGAQLAELYKAQGLNMLAERATFTDGTNGVEAGVQDILDLMLSGRFFVCDDLSEWFEEFRFYHRADGKIVKMNDDLMSATRYAFMMQRFAETSPREQRRVDRGRVLNWKTM